MQDQIDQAKRREMTRGTFVSLGAFEERAKGDLRIERTQQILKFLSSCWQKDYRDDLLVQDIMSMTIKLLPALFHVFFRSLAKMGPAFF